MTRERAKELLPLIQAFVNWKEIQARSKEPAPWVEVIDPRWLDTMEYRIKPEPMEAWILVYDGSRPGGAAYNNEKLANDAAKTQRELGYRVEVRHLKEAI